MYQGARSISTTDRTFDSEAFFIAIVLKGETVAATGGLTALGAHPRPSRYARSQLWSIIM